MSRITQATTQQLKNWIASNEVILLDVREPFENAADAIENSINIPLASLTVNDAKMLSSGDKKLVIYCKSGKRSMTACQILAKEELPFDVIYNLEGGIEAWRRED